MRVIATPTSTRDGQREYLYEKLDASFPGLRAKYAARYGEKYQCPSPRAHELSEVFAGTCERLGLLHRMPDIVAAYRKGYGGRQLALFE